MKKLFIFICMLSLCSAANAEKARRYELSVKFIKDKCDFKGRKRGDAKLEKDYNYCMGLVHGMNFALKNYQGTLMCVPDGVDHVKQLQILLDWVRENESLRNEDQLSGFVYALGREYPCD